MNGSIAINAAMRMIDFTNRGFYFLLVLMIISLSVFYFIIVSIWINIELLKKPAQTKLTIVFLNKSISL